MRFFAVISFIGALATTFGAEAAAQSPVLRFQIIEADGFTETDPAIADVRDVLADLFRFRGYRLAAEAVIRVGGGEFSQDVASAEGAVFHLNGEHVALIQGDGPEAGNVAITGLSLWRGSNQRILETSLTVPVGQTVVVGSARPDNQGPTLILVVRTQLR